MDTKRSDFGEIGSGEASATVSKPDPAYFSTEKPAVISISSGAENDSTKREDRPHGGLLAPYFRYAMGIENDHLLVPLHLAQRKAIDPIWTGSNEGRRAVNLGIYNRAIREERDCAVKFRLWSLVINGALGLQIIFAAILTALGAGSGPHDVVALFGALNTIIAGFLTYLKGTGLPMRMKYFHNQWLKLRAYIEQRERDFASDDNARVHRITHEQLLEEIEIVEKMYENIRKDIERHTPDSYQGSKDGGGDNGPGEGAHHDTFAHKGIRVLKTKLTGAGAELSHKQEDIESRVRGAVEDVEKRLSGHLTAHLAKIEENKKEPGQTVSDKQQAKQPTADVTESTTKVADDLDSDELKTHDVSDIALMRTRQIQAQALEAQRQAEEKVKELEQKLASISEKVAEKAVQIVGDRQHRDTHS